MEISDNSLLNLSEDVINQQLLLDNISGSEQPAWQQPKFKSVEVIPGFCLKSKTEKDEKIFINVCKGDLPEVKDISDEELLKLIDSEDPSGFRIPLSLGEPHAEVDKSGHGCTAYDVLVNGEFFEKLSKRQVLMGFFTTVVLEGLEHKYDMKLSRNWVILKNRKYLGAMQEHNIRTESKPWIMEMDNKSNEKKGGLISEVNSSQEQNRPKAPEPPYTILQEPPEGHPEFLVAEIHLPKIKTAASMTMDIGEDRILLQTRSNVYHLDIYLPYSIIQEECGAQFDKKSKILTLTMPVQPL